MTDRTEAMDELIALDAPLREEIIGMLDGGFVVGCCLIGEGEARDIADALLPIITRERERAARAALEAAGDRIADFQKPVREMCLAEPFSDVRIGAMMALEKAEIEARALSPADIVKGMK